MTAPGWAVVAELREAFGEKRFDIFLSGLLSYKAAPELWDRIFSEMEVEGFNLTALQGEVDQRTESVRKLYEALA